jgi:hypothetical protein
MSPNEGDGKVRRAISKKKRFDIFKRDGFTCQYCGRSAPGVVLEVEHIHAVSRGGSDDDTNLLCACFDCNRSKGADVVLITRNQRPFGLSRGIALVEYEDKPVGCMGPMGAEMVGLYGHLLHDRALRVAEAVGEHGGHVEGTEAEILSQLGMPPGDEAFTGIEECIVSGVLGLTDHGDAYFELWSYHPGPRDCPIRWGQD